MKMAFVLLGLFLACASSCKRGGKMPDFSLATLYPSPFASIRDSIVEGDDPSSPKYYKGRIVNGEKEGFWIENRLDSVNYKHGKLHGKCIRWYGADYDIREVVYYEEGKQEGVTFRYDYGYNQYETVNYKNGKKQGYEYTYRLENDSIINVCRYDDEGSTYPFMYLYSHNKVFHNLNQYDGNYKGRRISLGGNDECFIQDGAYEYAGEIDRQVRSDTTEYADMYKGYVTEVYHNSSSPSPYTVVYNKCGEWIKYHRAVPVEYLHYDHRGVLEYSHQITDYELNGSYAKYINGVLAESGTAKALPKPGSTTKEKLEVAKAVAVTALTIATALGGRGGGIGGSSSKDMLYEARHLKYDYVFDGDIVFYNPDGTVRRTVKYSNGKVVSDSGRSPSIGSE